ncbi:hypothetical protein B0T11DRAFT_133261 [Plectosphaerella cucumerina]|uniref:AB hydrolase-1 domain-containing protein n=1 Tax=Plectosphaerella cucumerina TaxID=40658 RepID=A0A8K0WYP5_9PEZI|nr:hypothetical protein B0T11DRAFT_133261 [Plectosphaerella cucumerina]
MGPRTTAPGKAHYLYVVFRAVLTLVNHIGLASLLYFFAILSLAGVRGIAHPVSITILVAGLVEILFYLAWFLPYQAYRQSPGPQPVPLTRVLRRQLFDRAVNFCHDPELFLRGWFDKAHMDDIRVENVKEWLAWALFDRESDYAEDDPELNEYIAEFEERGGVKIKQGTGDAESIRLSFDPVVMRHRSLLFYTGVGLLDAVTTIALLAKGFKYYRQPRSSFFTTYPFRFKTLVFPNESPYAGLSYFYRPHTSKEKRPIVLLHGAGVGLLAYIPWLASIPPDVGVLVVEFLAISSRITAPLPTTKELVGGIATIIGNHYNKVDGSDEFVLVSHSFGSLMLSPLLQRPDVASRVASLVVVDPLPFLIHLPDLTYNLTRRKPRLSHPNDWRMRFFATDPNVSYTFARRFCWHDFVLWTEQLQGRRTTVILGGEDGLINADAVASYIYYGDLKFAREDRREWRTTPGRWTGQEELALYYLDGLDHCESILHPVGRAALAKVVGAYCERSITWTSRFAEEIKLGDVTSPISPVTRSPEMSEPGIGVARTSEDARPLTTRDTLASSAVFTRYSETSRVSRGLR